MVFFTPFANQGRFNELSCQLLCCAS